MNINSISKINELLIKALRFNLILLTLLIMSSAISFFFFKQLFADISLTYGFLMVWLKDIYLLVGSFFFSFFIVYILSMLKITNKKFFRIILVIISLNLICMIMSFDYAMLTILVLIFVIIFLISISVKNYIK